MIFCQPQLASSKQEKSSSSTIWIASKSSCSTIRLLETRSGTSSTELLGLASSWVSNEKSLVVLDHKLLQLSLGGLIVILLVEGNEALGDSLTDGHDLGAWTSTTDTNAHVKILEFVSTQKEDGFVNLEAERRGFKELDGLSVDFDETSSSGDVCDRSSILFSSEALDLLGFTLLFLGHIVSLRPG